MSGQTLSVEHLIVVVHLCAYWLSTVSWYVSFEQLFSKVFPALNDCVLLLSRYLSSVYCAC